MTKAPITGGVAEYSRSRKVADYENKSAKISFNVGEGEDTTAKVVQALQLAIGYVHTALGITGEVPAFPTEGEKVAVVEAVGGYLSPTANSAVAEKKPRNTKKPPTPAAPPAGGDVTSLVEGGVTPPQIRTNPENRTDPADVAALIEFSAEAPAAAEIADKQLSDAVTRRNAVLVTAHKDAGPPMIRKLIGEFVNPGQSLYSIPAGKRAAFLVKLEELK